VGEVLAMTVVLGIVTGGWREERYKPAPWSTYCNVILHHIEGRDSDKMKREYHNLLCNRAFVYNGFEHSCVVTSYT
jgi:hypothetical protein